jgi:hypothetical protein
MELTGAGTAVMLAIAAVLWFLYFVPTWIARREYLDTERTATRLQQTLRIMAETAEVPQSVRVEVSAREAARQARVLRAQRRAEDRRAAAEAAHAAQLARTSVVARPGSAEAISWSRSVAATPENVARLRRRRAHRLATTLMIAATVTIAAQLWVATASGMSWGAWIVIAAGAALGLAGVSVRRRIDVRAARSAAERPRVAIPVAAQPLVAQDAPRASTWTPVPLPPPLYLSKPEVQSVEPAPDLAAQLRLAQLAAEQALRAAHAEPEVVPFAPPAPSRWAAMGRVDATGGTNAAAPDLDEVLRRRRTAG